jgi:hypothetical protein
MEKVLGNILKIILILMIVAVGSVLITGGAEILSNLGSHIVRLFNRARIFPINESFIQLIFIAVFVGWAISRF